MLENAHKLCFLVKVILQLHVRIQQLRAKGRQVQPIKYEVLKHLLVASLTNQNAACKVSTDLGNGQSAWSWHASATNPPACLSHVRHISKSSTSPHRILPISGALHFKSKASGKETTTSASGSESRHSPIPTLHPASQEDHTHKGRSVISSLPVAIQLTHIDLRMHRATRRKQRLRGVEK